MSRIPLVLLHGWGFTPAVWQLVADAVQQQGITLDRIRTPALPLTTSATSTDGFQVVLNALHQQLPEPAHLIGWSLGGELALALALRFPDQVASLTLISSTPCFMNQDTWTAGQPPSLLDDFAERLSADPSALLKRFSMLIRHGDVLAARDRTLSDKLQDLYDNDPERLATGLRLLREIDLRATAAQLKVPMQLIHGTNDAVTLPTAAEWLQMQNNATRYMIAEASHALPLTHPQQVAAQLIAFIGQRS